MNWKSINPRTQTHNTMAADGKGLYQLQKTETGWQALYKKDRWQPAVWLGWKVDGSGRVHENRRPRYTLVRLTLDEAKTLVEKHNS